MQTLEFIFHEIAKLLKRRKQDLDNFEHVKEEFKIPGTKSAFVLDIGMKDYSGQLASKRFKSKYVYTFELKDLLPNQDDIDDPDSDYHNPGENVSTPYADMEDHFTKFAELKQQITSFYNHWGLESRLIKESKSDIKPLIEKLEKLSNKKVVLEKHKK